MARRKKIKMETVGQFENVFLGNDENLLEGIQKYFGNDNPITLEIGCGRGDYSIGLANEFKNRNFIGVDLKGERIWNGSEKATSLNLSNVIFLVSQADRLAEFFTSVKVSEIWIPFPDPHLKSKGENKRLVSPKYLEIYKNILSEEGKVILKTDDDFLYEYAVETLNNLGKKIIRKTHDLYSEKDLSYEEKIKTKYEEKHLSDGKTIKIVKFIP